MNFAGPTQYAMDISDWTFSGSGFAQAVKREYIWGARSRELSMNSRFRKFIIILRGCEIAEYVSLVLVASFFLYFFFVVDPSLDR
jgi:hypothetical protein